MTGKGFGWGHPRAFVRPLALCLAVAATALGQADDRGARRVPREGLIGYVQFDGLSGHEAAWRKTAAYRMLNETTLGVMLEDLFTQTADSLLKDAPAPRPTGAELLANMKASARTGLTLGVLGKLGGDDLSAVLVVRDAPREWTEALATLAKSSGKSERVKREDGRTVTTVHPSPAVSWSWWLEKSDLVMVFGKSPGLVDAVVETAEGKKPSAADHPNLSALRRAENGFDPVLISFIDLTGLPPTPPALGLSGLKRLETAWGFQDEALVTRVRLTAPAPRTGLLALMDQPGFSLKEGVSIPEGVSEFSVVSLDLVKLHDATIAALRASDPNTAGMVARATDAVSNATGLKLRDEILASVGSTFTFHASGDRLPVPMTPYHGLLQWFLHLPTFTMSFDLKNEKVFKETLDSLATIANRELAALSASFGREEVVSLRPLKNGRKGYELDVPLGLLPLPNGIRPVIEIKEGRASLSTDIEGARASLSAPRKPFAGRLATAFAGVPDRLVSASASDPADYMPELLADLPFFVQAFASAVPPAAGSGIGGLRLKIDRDRIPTPASLRAFMFPSSMSVSVDEQGLLMTGRDAFPNFSSAAAVPITAALMLPAVSSAREAARRTQSVNNLKQIMLAFHNYHDVNGRFPPAAITDAEGKPLLSWRVAILPYIEQNALYEQFHLDEPWDSPHNKKLSETVLAIYSSPNLQPEQRNMTFYQMLVGPGALNEKHGDKGVNIASITDGTSNTIAVVEAAKGVIWTKPDDVKFDPEKRFPKLGGPGFRGGFNAGFCDGSVRFLLDTTDETTLKSMTTKAGGEVIEIN